MSLPIYVDAYSGYRANERPQSFTLDEDAYEIASVEDRWYEPDAGYFKVRTTDAKTYLLRYEQQGDVWTLQSGFDGDEFDELRVTLDAGFSPVPIETIDNLEQPMPGSPGRDTSVPGTIVPVVRSSGS